MVGIKAERGVDVLFHFTKASDIAGSGSSKTPIRIFMAEDTPGDVRLIKEGFHRTSLEPVFQIAEDGQIAMNAIQAMTEGSPPPDLFLIDLNLPFMSGHDLLAQIRKTDRLSEIPVIVLTSSLLDEDLAKANTNKADLYMIKPINLNDYFETIARIARFWREWKNKK